MCSSTLSHTCQEAFEETHLYETHTLTLSHKYVHMNKCVDEHVREDKSKEENTTSRTDRI